MAHKQVGARTEGDVYQGLFFWRQAAELLRESSKVREVILEHDAADGVDDVAVVYEPPGIVDGPRMCEADYFQLKYHVDNRKCYSADALINPNFIKAKSSLLQRFHVAYLKLSAGHTHFRLHLASNWRWQEDDKLARWLREFDGALPESFFSGGEKSDLGKIRKAWCNHLKLSDAEFIPFARTLRFQLDHFGRREFKALVNATLEAAGLIIPSADHAACPYESLVQKFLMDGPNSFNRVSMHQLCVQEGLLAKSGQSVRKLRELGVRSRIRFAERLDDEVDEIICVAKHFSGRHPTNDESWVDAAEDIVAYFEDEECRARFRSGEHTVALECHGSLALLVGYELSRSSGVAVYPIQKPQREIWRSEKDTKSDRPTWVAKAIDYDSERQEVAVCLSVTHDIKAAVTQYLSEGEGAPNINKLVEITLETGASPQSILGANHALELSNSFVALLSALRTNPADRFHLFFAAPNALMYFIGQHREALGRITAYEFDFGLERDFSYAPSISLPSSNRRDNEGEK